MAEQQSRRQPQQSSNRGRNNNPTGRNQYSGGWMDIARDRPIAAAAAAAGAVGAGVFLWSKRNQISDQLSNLSDQIERMARRHGVGSDDSATQRGSASVRQQRAARHERDRRRNASLGARPAAADRRVSASGRGRAEHPLRA